MELNNSKKECPYCGNYININAKKCRFCNNWIEEEVPCPFCAEKIKKTAKKCHFCGEWLDKGKKIEEENNNNQTEYVSNKKNPLKIIILFVLVILILASVVFASLYFYIEKYDSDKILDKVKQNLYSKYSNASNITLDKFDINVISHNNKGYTCQIGAKINNNPTKIKYSYTKVGFNDYNIETEIILPDCYDNLVKNLLVELIKETKGYYNISDTVSEVTTDYETILDSKNENGNKEYSCSANVKLKAKPGKAFVLYSWNLADATLNMKCQADYATYFCQNGYTTCVKLQSLDKCENIEE